MGRTTELRRSLKTTFHPFAEARGFRVDDRDAPTIVRFRRVAPEVVHIFELQWEKYGRPRFAVNFGACPLAGLEIDGRLYAPEELFAGWLPRHGRLQPRPGPGPGSWFRQDRPWLARLLSGQSLRPASEVVDELMRLFPELEEHWTDGRVGRHLRMFRR